MRPPKLIGKLSPGMAVGEGKVKALEQVGVPYLTSSGPGFIARTNGGFSSVESTDEQPEKYWNLWVGIRYLDTNYLVPRLMKIKRRAKRINVRKASASVVMDSPIWVGAGYMLCDQGRTVRPPEGAEQFSTGLDSIPDAIPMHTGFTGPNYSWRSDGPIDNTGYQYYFVSFLGLWPLKSRGYYLNIVASGWSPAMKSYAWCWGGVTPGERYSGQSSYGYPESDEGHAARFRNTPFVMIGYVTKNSVTGVHRVDLPFEPDREHEGSIHCVGPGELLAFISVREQFTRHSSGSYMYDLEPMILPYYCVSHDSGETWERRDAGFSYPFIAYTYRAAGFGDAIDYGRDILSDPPILVSCYVGQGKTIFILDGQYLDVYSVQGTAYYQYRVGGSALLLYDGSSFVQKPWPLGARRLEEPDPWGPANSFSYVSAPHPVCFGEGCMVFTYSFLAEAPEGFVVTRDFGDTWELKPYASLGITNIFFLEIVTLIPWETAAKPGVIIVTVQASEAEDVTMWRLTGAFDSAEIVGVCPGLDRGTALLGTAAHVYFPNRGVRLELPREFNEPENTI
jgi:hypothetical protein